MLTAACGRVGYDATALATPCGGVDGGSGRDAGMPGTDAGRPECTPLPADVTEEQCAAAARSLGAAPDDVVYACGAACMLGACIIWNAEACPTCACDAYVRSDEVCGPAGDCGEPLNGTGCLGLGFYGAMPWRCPTDTLIAEGACMLRYLDMSGVCDGTP